MRDLLSAVSYIHYNDLIHRDIKLENIRFLKLAVIDHIKLLDFGSACFHKRNSETRHYELSGSPYYCSPEMLSGMGYDEKTDVWSCGIIFHYLLTGSFPYNGQTDM